MIFADKLIQLRKKRGWSQEELAEQMEVTRQSVSKWEGAQSIPDLGKVLRLSELFGVSTDYLLKDEIEETEYLDSSIEDMPSLRRVSMEEANAFLAVKEETSKSIAYATLLCILSPISLFILGALSEVPKYGLAENVAGGVGMLVLIIFIIAAVTVFISSGHKTEGFLYLEKEAFETEYGVSGMVKERRENYRSTYTKSNMIGTCMCLAAVVPIFSGLIVSEDNDLLMIGMLSITFIIAGIGVVFFIRSGIIWASFEKLLQEGDYSREKKKRMPFMSAVAVAYWLISTAIYLAYSFASNNWEQSWIVWVVAGLLYPALIRILNLLYKD